MIPVPRWAVSVVAMMFCVYPAVLALVGWFESSTPVQLVISVILYLGGVVPTLTMFELLKLPRWLAGYNVAIAVLIPALLLPGINPDQVGDYSTWFVGALASLSAATAFRDRIPFGILIVVAVAAQVIIWGGAGAIMGTGVVGAVIFFVVGALMSRGIRGTQLAAESFRAKQRKTLAETAFVTAAREEHQRRIAEALNQAVPQLREIANTPGDFSDELKAKSQLLEAALRDEIRGRGLVNPAIKKAVLEARARGVEVILLDEGGLEDATNAERDELLAKAAAAIDGIAEGRITLRAPLGEEWRITVMATRSGVAKPDLWLKL